MDTANIAVARPDSSTRTDLVARAGLVVVLLAVAWVGTYAAGGTRTVAPHLFYLPVLYAALRFSPPAAVSLAVVAGVLAGPLMPLNVQDGTEQTLLNWMARLAAFVIAALAASVLRRRDLQVARRQQQALRARAEVSRRQRDFLTHVHHELRTPVTVVYGTIELLFQHGDRLDQHTQDRLRDAAYRNAKSLSRLVEDLTAGVDEALPGLASTQDVDNWSSSDGQRRRATDAQYEIFLPSPSHDLSDLA